MSLLLLFVNHGAAAPPAPDAGHIPIRIHLPERPLLDDDELLLLIADLI